MILFLCFYVSDIFAFTSLLIMFPYICQFSFMTPFCSSSLNSVVVFGHQDTKIKQILMSRFLVLFISFHFISFVSFSPICFPPVLPCVNILISCPFPCHLTLLCAPLLCVSWFHYSQFLIFISRSVCVFGLPLFVIVQQLN